MPRRLLSAMSQISMRPAAATPMKAGEGIGQRFFGQTQTSASTTDRPDMARVASCRNLLLSPPLLLCTGRCAATYSSDSDDEDEPSSFLEKPTHLPKQLSAKKVSRILGVKKVKGAAYGPKRGPQPAQGSRGHQVGERKQLLTISAKQHDILTASRVLDNSHCGNASLHSLPHRLNRVSG